MVIAKINYSIQSFFAYLVAYKQVIKIKLGLIKQNFAKTIYDY